MVPCNIKNTIVNKTDYIYHTTIKTFKYIYLPTIAILLGMLFNVNYSNKVYMINVANICNKIAIDLLLPINIVMITITCISAIIYLMLPIFSNNNKLIYSVSNICIMLSILITSYINIINTFAMYVTTQIFAT
jgi:hypothetical protein